MSQTPILHIDHLSKSFGARKAVNALTLDVYPGEIVGFLGPNGAGKTTTIKMVTGFLSIDEGLITVGGYDVSQDKERALALVGGIVEAPEVYGYLTGRQNLKLYARLHGGLPTSRIQEVLTAVGLDKRADEAVKRYSLGMKQRISLAQALVHAPKLLILDEPTNGLDPAGIHELRDLLKTLAHRDNIAVFISSHQLAEMQQICDRVAIIANGSMLCHCDVADLANKERGRRVVIEVMPESVATARQTFERLQVLSQETDDANAFTVNVGDHGEAGLIRALVNDNVDIRYVTPVQTTLEQAFLAITGGQTIE